MAKESLPSQESATPGKRKRRATRVLQQDEDVPSVNPSRKIEKSSGKRLPGCKLSNCLKKKKHDDYTLLDLKIMGNQLLSSRAHINNLPILLNFISPSFPPEYVLESLLSLQSLFIPLLPLLPSRSTSVESNPDPEFIYRTWLRSKFDDLVEQLCRVYVSPKSEDVLQEVVLDAIMEFVKVGNAGKFHSAIYHKLLHAIVVESLEGADDARMNLLTRKYFNFIDVRYFTYVSLKKLARIVEGKEDENGSLDLEDMSQSKSSMDFSIRKIMHLLSHIPSLEASEEKPDLEIWSNLGIFTERSNNKELIDQEDSHAKPQKLTSKVMSRNVAKKMKQKFTKAWMAFLGSPLPLDVYKEVLVKLHEVVIPYISNPIMLCDFLTRSYDIGGVISVMALSGLYILMTQHGLEYPNFYNKLYALLEPSIFLAKHRAKFFQLLDSCLKSSLLPAYLAAAFCKKLSRLTLQVPPSGGLVCVALVHNLLQRHPSISCLFHQECGTLTGRVIFEEENASIENKENCSTSRELFDEKRGFDHFKNEESDPKNTNAMRSSLWEIDNLRHHYCPAVSRFALSLESDLAARARTVEVAVKDFSSASYATIFDSEIRRRVKQVPLAFHESTPTSLFSEHDFPGWNNEYRDGESTKANDNIKVS